MRNIVRVGDMLRPYGGQVLEGRYECLGPPVACVGDAARCNKHGLTLIAEGCAESWVDGRPVALDGHRCECGCTLVSSAPDFLVAP